MLENISREKQCKLKKISNMTIDQGNANSAELKSENTENDELSERGMPDFGFGSSDHIQEFTSSVFGSTADPDRASNFTYNKDEVKFEGSLATYSRELKKKREKHIWDGSHSDSKLLDGLSGYQLWTFIDSYVDFCLGPNPEELKDLPPTKYNEFRKLSEHIFNSRLPILKRKKRRGRTPRLS